MSEFYGYVTNCPCEYCEQEKAREARDKAAAAAAAEASKLAHPVPTSRLLTLEMVLKGSPCYEYRNRFTERYGKDGVVVTVEKALSESNDWDWEWAGAVLLSRKAKAEFSRRSREADKAYDETMQPYWDLSNAAYDRYLAARDAAQVTAEYRALGWNDRYDYLDKASVGILEIPNAAQGAAEEIAAKRRSDARIIAFAELFILDGAAYEEEHKDDEPFVNPYEDEDDEFNEEDYYDED